MAKNIIKSDAFIRGLKPLEMKVLRVSDGENLYLLVNPSGTKGWRFDFVFDGLRKTISFGAYPKISLSLARSRADEARQMLVAGINPSDDRKNKKTAKTVKKEDESRASKGLAPIGSFAYYTEQWLLSYEKTVSKKVFLDTGARIRRYIFPFFGNTPIEEIKRSKCIECLRFLESANLTDTTRRALGDMLNIFDFAGLEINPAVRLHKVLARRVAIKHHAAIIDEIGARRLMRKIDLYETYLTRCALKLSALFFVRPGELRQAEWSEIDLDAAQWQIPAEKMKMRQAHIVPLAAQALVILRHLKQFSGGGKYVFPATSKKEKPMSENTIRLALRRIGYDRDEMSAHGFRAMARTLLDEVLHERVDLIEHQLAHDVRDTNGRAYNRTTHLPERRAMMQRWADWLNKS